MASHTSAQLDTQKGFAKGDAATNLPLLFLNSRPMYTSSLSKASEACTQPRVGTGKEGLEGDVDALTAGRKHTRGDELEPRVGRDEPEPIDKHTRGVELEP